MKRISTRISSEVESQADGIVEDVAREHLDSTKTPKGPKEVRQDVKLASLRGVSIVFVFYCCAAVFIEVRQ